MLQKLNEFVTNLKMHCYDMLVHSMSWGCTAHLNGSILACPHFFRLSKNKFRYRKKLKFFDIEKYNFRFPKGMVRYLRHHGSYGADTLRFDSTDEYFKTVEHEPDRMLELRDSL